MRKLCEAYWGTTPRDWEDCTLSQLYVACANIDDLKRRWGGQSQLTPGQAADRGCFPKGYQPYAGGKSYLMRMREQKAQTQRKDKRQRRRERRT